MIIKIHSKSGYLADILNKNPQSDYGLYMKPYRNGVIVGNIVDKYNYEAIFLDNKYSFCEAGESQIDYKSLCVVIAALSIFTELFNHIYSIDESSKIAWLDKFYHEVDDECTITIENLLIDTNYVDRSGNFFLTRYFNGLEVIRKASYTDIYTLRISDSSVISAINKTALVLFLLQSVSYDNIYPTAEMLKKYIKILGNIKEAPYFIYYIINKKLGDKFASLIPLLENYYSKNNNISAFFTPYSTQEDRIRFVKNHINTENSIVDLGCGEMTYSRILIPQLAEGKNYYSIDKEDYSDLHAKLKERYKYNNWYFYNNLESIPKDEPLSLLVSEMIEHEPIEYSLNLLKDITSKWTVKNLIITTPNISFNKYYNLQTELRHPDHVQELNETEFIQFISELGGTKIYYIGDIVDGCPTTFGAIINYV